MFTTARLNLEVFITTNCCNCHYRHLDNVVILRDNIYTEREEGRMEGRAEEKTENARNLKRLGVFMDIITGHRII